MLEGSRWNDSRQPKCVRIHSERKWTYWSTIRGVNVEQLATLISLPLYFAHEEREGFFFNAHCFKCLTQAVPADFSSSFKTNLKLIVRLLEIVTCCCVNVSNVFGMLKEVIGKTWMIVFLGSDCRRALFTMQTFQMLLHVPLLGHLFVAGYSFRI